jgi:hypothetical protein
MWNKVESQHARTLEVLNFMEILLVADLQGKEVFLVCGRPRDDGLATIDTKRLQSSYFDSQMLAV